MHRLLKSHIECCDFPTQTVLLDFFLSTIFCVRAQDVVRRLAEKCPVVGDALPKNAKKLNGIEPDGGTQLDKRATARFREHKGGAMHLLCAQAQSDAAADSIPAAITREREERKKKGEKKEDLGLLFPFLSRAVFIFLVHSQPTEQKNFPVSRAVARSTGRGLLRRPGVSQIPFTALS